MTGHDAADAERFLRALGGRFTFQTFDDDKARRQRRDPLAKWMHGTIADHADRLADLNARGAGVFVMVNEGDGKGRSERNVRRIRACFADFDGTQPPDAAAQPLRPHCIIESSPGRWHWYWWIEGAPPGTFKPMQRALAERYGSDARIIDLPRVMRLPGFLHRKGEPFLTRIVELREARRYAQADFAQAFGIDLFTSAQPMRSKRKADAEHVTVTRLPAQRHKRTLTASIPEGERNSTLLSLAAGLVRKGHNPQAVTDRLQRLNAERCQPPLCATEVDGIAARAVGYGSEGWMRIPHELWDSPAFQSLPEPSKMIELTAFRRFNGFNRENIALTHDDCEDIRGCRDEKTFLAYRALTVAAGLLVIAKQPMMTRNGKTPTLYAIPPQFLPSLTGQNTQLAHTGQNTPSYIDKQSLEALDRDPASDGSKTHGGANAKTGTTR